MNRYTLLGSVALVALSAAGVLAQSNTAFVGQRDTSNFVYLSQIGLRLSARYQQRVPTR